MNRLFVEILPVLQDNYIFILKDPRSKEAVIIDPAESGPVVDHLQSTDFKPVMIWNTHHHGDHVGGNQAIKAAYDCQILASAYDKDRISCVDRLVEDGDVFFFAGQRVQVISTPGHTLGHVCYFLPEANILFAGDTLFSMGCGRLFEGDALQMWTSLSKLLALPDETQIYCTHEYTLANARFARTLEPENSALIARQEEATRLRLENKPTIPTRLDKEKQTNPFLRAKNLQLRAFVGLTEAADWQVFKEIRLRKDAF